MYVVRGMVNNICVKTLTLLDLRGRINILRKNIKSLGRVFLPRCILENRRVPAGSLEELRRLKYRTVGEFKIATSTAPTQNG